MTDLEKREKERAVIEACQQIRKSVDDLVRLDPGPEEVRANLAAARVPVDVAFRLTQVVSELSVKRKAAAQAR